MTKELPPFPEKDGRQIAYEATQIALSNIPVCGELLKNIMASVIGAPLEKRREEWFRQLGTALQDLQQAVRELDLSEVANNPDFVTIVYETTHLAMRTHQQERLDILKNVVLNTAKGMDINEVLRGRFVALLETFTPLHIKVLRLLQDFSISPEAVSASACNDPTSVPNVLFACIPEINNDSKTLNAINDDLVRENFTRASVMVRLNSGKDLMRKRTMPGGDAFLNFINNPLP